MQTLNSLKINSPPFLIFINNGEKEWVNFYPITAVQDKKK